MSADHVLRVNTCRSVAAGFAEGGRILNVGGHVLKEKRAQALALLAQMSGEMAKGTVTALEADNFYAGATLIRQLIEAQYLLAYFADSPAEAEQWLNASSSQIDRHFRPGTMRKAGGFSASEYKSHCQIGGHPDPRGYWLLPDHEPLVPLELLWVDLAQHLADAWRHFGRCVVAMGYQAAMPSLIGQVTADIEHWQANDGEADRIRMPTYE